MKKLIVGFIAVLGLMVCPAAAQAQTRGFLTIDFGAQKPKDTFFFQNLVQDFRGEDAEFDAEYDLKTMPFIAVGGGFMVTDAFGFGVTFSQARREGEVIAFASIPHPVLFNSNATAESIVDGFVRRERALHLHAIYAINAGNLVIRLSGGPTYFRLTQDLVNDIRYSETIGPPHRISITEVRFDTYEANKWGWNMGADVSYYFTDVLGIGGLVRYSKANGEGVPLIFALGENFGSTQRFDNRVGGIQYGGGLRLRF